MWNVALELRDAEKIHLRGHDVDHVLKCVYCHMTEYILMKNHTCGEKKPTSASSVKVLLHHFIKCLQSAQKEPLEETSPQCTSSETEQISNLHVACLALSGYGYVPTQ